MQGQFVVDEVAADVRGRGLAVVPNHLKGAANRLDPARVGPVSGDCREAEREAAADRVAWQASGTAGAACRFRRERRAVEAPWWATGRDRRCPGEAVDPSR